MIKKTKNHGNKKSKKRDGFTIIELIVSSIVIIVIFSFVLANFRLGQTSASLDSTLKQAINGIETARQFTLAGRVLDEGLFPGGGYGIEFRTNPSSYQIFAIPNQGGPDYLLEREYQQFLPIDFFSPFSETPELGFLATSNEMASEPECYIGNYLRIIFAGPDNIYAEWDKDNYPCDLEQGIKYVGALLRDKKNNQQAYFYVSLLSGMVSGSLIYE